MSNTCGSSYEALEQGYNLALHIGAVFIILFVSGSACAFPLIVVKIPQLRVPTNFLFFVRHFGTGVLLATAFVHLLPTAFTSLTDPCLPPFWNQKYPAMAGAIAMAGVFAIVVVEMVFSPGRSMCKYPDEVGQRNGELDRNDDIEGSIRTADGKNGRGGLDDVDEISEARDVRPIASNSMGNEQRRRANSIASVQHSEKFVGMMKQEQQREYGDHSEASISSRRPSLTSLQRCKRETLQCMLLEMGILFHSIFIGMALSVAIGNDFVVLLIAISFHQTFEGLALGSRIAAVSFPRKAYQPWLMALAYGCTTPIGQGIGLAIHSAYDPQSATGLIMVGVMNAISSGLLTYASLVELMAEDFLSDHSWRILRGKRRIVACALVFAGAFCMALVGAWA